MSAEAPSGAWLLIERDGQSPVALPVPRQACLGLTRAVLFRGGADEAAFDAVRVFAGGDPGIEQWLAASSQGPGGPRSSLVRRLAETLILADDLRSGRAEAARFIDAEACRSPADEALVLRDAVRAAAALEACEGRFQAAVAEARIGRLARALGAEVEEAVLIVAQLREQEALPWDQALERAGNDRLRPVMMTCFASFCGLLPMALASGIGADVQKPLAIVVVGGIGLVPLFVLVVLPALIDLISRPSEAFEKALAAEGLSVKEGGAE